MTARNPADLAATVRDALNGWKSSYTEASLALDALLAQAETAEGEENYAGYGPILEELTARAEAAEQRATDMEKALRDVMALIVIDDDGAAEAIRMEDWGPVWLQALAALSAREEAQA